MFERFSSECFRNWKIYICAYIISARIEQIQKGLGDLSFYESNIPTLAHRGNVTPKHDEEDGKNCFSGANVKNCTKLIFNSTW